MQKNPSDAPVTLEKVIREQCVVIGSCVVAEREWLLKTGGFDPEWKYCEDFDMWLRFMLAGGKIGFHRSVLGRRRLHRHSLSTNTTAMLRTAAEVLENMQRKFRLSEEQESAARAQISRFRSLAAWYTGKQMLAEGNVAKAREAFAEAARGKADWRGRVMQLLLCLPGSISVYIYNFWQKLLYARLALLRKIR